MTKLKLIILLFLFPALNIYSQNYAQQDSILMSALNAYKKSYVQDSIDNSSFCQQKKYEFDSLRKVFKAKCDSIYAIVNDLNSISTTESGYYRVKYDPSSVINFDWKGCFPGRIYQILEVPDPITVFYYLDECISAYLVIGYHEYHFDVYPQVTQPLPYSFEFDIRRMMIDPANSVNRTTNR